MYDSELLELHTESYQRRAIGTPQCIREWSIKTISIMEVLHHSWLLYSFFSLFLFLLPFFSFSHFPMFYYLFVHSFLLLEMEDWNWGKDYEAYE